MYTVLIPLTNTINVFKVPLERQDDKDDYSLLCYLPKFTITFFAVTHINKEITLM